MRPFVRVRMRGADEYRVLKKTVASRKLAAGKVRRAKKFVLISNQGHTALGYQAPLATLPPAPTDERLLQIVDQFSGSGHLRWGRTVREVNCAVTLCLNSGHGSFD